MQAEVDDILLNKDPTGEKTEVLMRKYIDGNDGWVHQTGGKYGSNNGYDNVFYNPSTGEVLIDESKQWGPTLTGENIDTELPKQMSNAWIQKVADEIRPNNEELANKIEYAMNNELLIKTVSAVKKTNPGEGSIVTIKVGG